MIVFIYYTLMIIYMIFTVLTTGQKYFQINNHQFKEINNKTNKKDKKTQDNNTLTLDDIIGLESVKEEIKYYLDFIKNREKYKKWNVKLQGLLAHIT
jgi:AAA+ superfamily predicted ATPase